MKQFKKTLSFLLLAAVMVMSLAVTAFATDITVVDGVDGAEYAAYKLLNATDGGDGKFAYTLNEKYTAILQSVTGKTEQAEIVDYVLALDEAGVRAFADSVYDAIVADTTVTADYTTDNDVFANVDQGYYLIAEIKVADETDTISLAMLKTAGKDSIEVITKEDLPTVEKLVREYNDSNEVTSLGKSADHDIGDAIDYIIMGTVSDKYEYYGSYYYCFEDTMVKGLTYNGDAKFYVINNMASNEQEDITSYFTVEVTTNAESGYANGFKAYANLKEIENVTIDANSTIVVEYTATLNEFAVVGVPGNENEVVLKYENDPYVDADGDPETPDEPDEPGKIGDTNVVFTFGTVVNKVDSSNNALEGAGFTLYKWYAAQDAWVAVGEEITGVTTFNFEGLDAGEYKLEETTVPEGYNKADDIIFTVVAEYDESVVPAELTNLYVEDENGENVSDADGEVIFSADIDAGKVTTNVQNLSGSELPETGGIGTTIFYVVGGILVVGAIVLLVAKKRMAQSND